MGVFFFFFRDFALGSRYRAFLHITPFFVWGSHTAPPPFPDPSSGPLALAQLTSTSCLRAKLSPRQPHCDWQGLGVWRGGPRAHSTATDWPTPWPRLCREADKESRALARCRRWEPREDEVGAEKWTCALWAGGAAGRPGPCGCTRQCAGCAVAEPSAGAVW